MLERDPTKRIIAVEALAHDAFFDNQTDYVSPASSAGINLNLIAQLQDSDSFDMGRIKRTTLNEGAMPRRPSSYMPGSPPISLIPLSETGSGVDSLVEQEAIYRGRIDSIGFDNINVSVQGSLEFLHGLAGSSPRNRSIYCGSPRRSIAPTEEESKQGTFGLVAIQQTKQMQQQSDSRKQPDLRKQTLLKMHTAFRSERGGLVNKNTELRTLDPIAQRMELFVAEREAQPIRNDTIKSESESESESKVEDSFRYYNLDTETLDERMDIEPRIRISVDYNMQDLKVLDTRNSSPASPTGPPFVSIR
eukprot:TRINITY_DN6045_c0_g1_i1.p1 TRINITY_DN6045_c0_g1~~TRINITY_DN6045_c0_g1_i1.p1  ORF type:complete len:305 (+),score=43.88 TRINITY_DN6045_c0_g1_i1:823-1737(+)